MIGYIRGPLLEVNADYLLIQVGGEVSKSLPSEGKKVSAGAAACLGYEVLVSGRWVASLWGQEGSVIEAWIYTHVREDSLQLFGFESKAQKSLFLSLLKVNGIGPKLGLGILSAAATDELIETIESGDAKKLSQFPRVGKKTAEQIILTLQGKLVRIESPSPENSGPQKQILFALKNLGFKEALVQEFIDKLPVTVTVEDGIRRGLLALSNARGDS